MTRSKSHGEHFWEDRSQKHSCGQLPEGGEGASQGRDEGDRRQGQRKYSRALTLALPGPSGLPFASSCEASKKLVAQVFFTGTGVVSEAASASSEGRPLATTADKESVWAELSAMYDDGSGYGNMSQAAHGLQTAFQAEQAG